MRNTGIEYSSTEHTPTVREDFANLLPPLSDEQLSLLEGDIFRNGWYTPIIVNEARGAVIDDAALVEALRTGEIWGAALDVWEKEPLDPEDPLCKFEKVITTSHLGAATRETVIRCFSIGYNNILRAMKGEELVNRVNK